MDVFTNLFEGIAAVWAVQNLLFLGVGVMLGMVVGVMPGLGASAGIAILLPLTFGLDPTSAIVLLAAVYYGSMYGGTITAVMLNTPGEVSSVATTFDGYPLARNGRPGPALVMAALSSFVAGTVGAILISLLAPLAAQVAASFGPPELFLLVLAGLLTLIIIISKNRMLGALSALIGFSLATVGIDIGVGEQRFTFGSAELINGIDFIPVAIGLFGLGEIFYSLWRGRHLESLPMRKISVRDRDFWPTKEDLRVSAGPIGRGSVLGFGIGTAPGAGATVASLMSYNVEKSLSQEPQKFGKGVMPGLTGPESATNGASSGAMVPLITVGIPGSGATAVLLAGFLMWGLQPGPLFMEENPDFAWALIASMFLGNMMLLVINIFMVPTFASIARVPLRILAPVIVVVCALGTYTVRGSFVEVAIMFICGVLGFFMRRFGMSPAALIIALVLGPLAEETLRQTMIVSGGNLGIFFERTTSLVLILGIILLLVLPLLGKIFGRQIKRQVKKVAGAPVTEEIQRVDVQDEAPGGQKDIEDQSTIAER